MSTTPPPSPLAGTVIDFVGSFPDPKHVLEPRRPEFALIGRSNVGKSSLLNALTGRKALARVSSTPGKTQLLNIYRLPTLYLIDLPGYGFAQASKGERTAYRKLLERVLRERTTLTGVIWLLDVRHAPSTDDLAFADLLAASGQAALAVLTKADKLSRKGQRDAVTARARELGVDEDQIQLVSSHTGLGIAELGASILAAAAADTAAVEAS